jgi:serine/threonine protein kinase
MAAGVGRLISSDSIPVGGLTPGAVLVERYRIIGLLGRGGMGEVYRADDLKLGQTVALKFLPPSLSSDAVRRERFFAEVRITRQLAHPNICRVYDIAEVDGQHFLSMEFIDGEDLSSLLKRIGYLSNEKALDIARQLLAGLAAAHERGVLHRDLKPANIMLDGRGCVRITDFGLAVAVTDESTVGDVSGTPPYMSPEQLAGSGASVRTDIYALGLILYEILSGTRAFSSTTLAELRAEKEQSTPTAPSDLRPGIDPVVERLVMRCLERDPRARPSSVAQLAMALPGGDPLAAAIAAGETPSPELVAASGDKDGSSIRSSSGATRSRSKRQPGTPATATPRSSSSAGLRFTGSGPRSAGAAWSRSRIPDREARAAFLYLLPPTSYLLPPTSYLLPPTSYLLPPSSSIASFASRSASTFSSRLTCSNVTCPIRRMMSRASAKSGCSPACFTRYSPRICFTSSSESERTCSRRTPCSRAHDSAASSPRYSATLFVQIPIDPFSSTTEPSSRSMRTP